MNPADRAPERVVFRPARYGPWVVSTPEGLRYDMPVESSIVSFIVSLPMSEADLAVLRSEEQRFNLLFAALHHPFQLRETRLSDTEAAEYFRVILHAPMNDVAAFLSGRNTASRNAIFHMARSLGKMPEDFR